MAKQTPQAITFRKRDPRPEPVRIPDASELQTFHAALLGAAFGRYLGGDPLAMARLLRVPSIELVPREMLAASADEDRRQGRELPEGPVLGTFHTGTRCIRLANDLDPERLSWILLHELAHGLRLEGEIVCDMFARSFISGVGRDVMQTPGLPTILLAALTHSFEAASEPPMLNYIEDAASIERYGVREASPIFKDIFPLGLTNADFAMAATTLYGLAVNYLQKHTQEQVAYEVEVLGLRHVNPATGVPYFRPGDTMRLQFDGWTQNADGTRTDYLQVDRDLYVLDFTVTYDSAGTPVTKLTLSTFLRAERSDSEIIKQMAKDIGIANVSPLQVFTIGDGAIRLDSTSIQLRTLGADVVAIYGLDELSAEPDTNASYWKLSGTANDAILANDVTLGLYTNGTARSRLFLGYGSFTQAALYASTVRSLYAANFNGQTGNYLAPIIQPTLANVAGVALTISSGVISLDFASYWLNGESAEHPGFIEIDTEAAAATDNLDTITGTGLRAGQLLVVRATNSARTVVLTESGNMKLSAATITLDNAEDTATLIYDGSNWLLIASSNNGA